MTKKRAIQNHHISYDPEWVVTVYKGEHEILGKAKYYSRKTVSTGFLTALENFIIKNRGRAVTLTK